MRTKLYQQLCIAVFIIFQTATAQPFVNGSLSNLKTITAVNASLLPQGSNQINLGSSTLRWKNVYLYNAIFPNGTIQTTAFSPYTAGTGIGIAGTKISNTAPDRIVTLTPGAGIIVSGSYPNFKVSATSSSAQWLIKNGSVYRTTGNVGIGTDNPLAKLEVAGADAIINGVTVGVGSGNINSNVTVGTQALYNNTSGFSNTVYGNNAMFSNTTGYDNSAIGENALYSNIDGLQNTSVGNGTLYSNISGTGNTAVGNAALLNNGGLVNPLTAPEGSYNVANGFFSLFNNLTGSHNTAIGAGTLNSNVEGSYNTAIGAYSDAAYVNINNATAIGANSIVNNSNKIRLGDVNVTVVESAAGSWTTSDGRFKTNVKEEVAGLSFIKLLRPVVYNFDADQFDAFLAKRLPDSVKAKRRTALQKENARTTSLVQTGFIAQEVAEAAKKAGYNFNGVHVPQDENDNYSLSYEKMVVPLVKAVQELARQNEEMKKEIQELKASLSLTGNNTQTINLTSAALQQNVPNPFISSTTISYHLPGSVKSAEIVITDKQGKKLKQFPLSGLAGSGTIEIKTGALAAGVYQYTLYINGNIADTKQMLLSK
jgi:trimeric autotransporter adhesin